MGAYLLSRGGHGEIGSRANDVGSNYEAAHERVRALEATYHLRPFGCLIQVEAGDQLLGLGPAAGRHLKVDFAALEAVKLPV